MFFTGQYGKSRIHDFAQANLHTLHSASLVSTNTNMHLISTCCKILLDTFFQFVSLQLNTSIFQVIYKLHNANNVVSWSCGV